MTGRTVLEGRSEAERLGEMPGGGHGARDHLMGLRDTHRIEPRDEHVVDRPAPILRCTAHPQLTERRRRTEARQRGRESGARPRRVEAAERMQVAGGMQDDLCRPAREEVHPLPELATGPLRPARDDAHHPRLPRRQADDAGGLAIIEGVEDDGVGADHRSNLSPRYQMRPGEANPWIWV